MFSRKPKPIDTAEGYDIWARSYAREAAQPLPRIEARLVLSLLPEVDGLDCLDLACGTGRHTDTLQEAGGRVVGMDRSAAMLARYSGARPVRGELGRLPFGERTFGLVVCGLALGHLDDPAEALREAGRVLRPGGSLVVSDFHARAAAAGLRRVFRSGTRTWELAHHPHERGDYERWLDRAGLRLSSWTESNAADLPEAFLGGDRLDASQRDLPLVFAFRAEKPAFDG